MKQTRQVTKEAARRQNRATGAMPRANMRDIYVATKRGTVLPGELFSKQFTSRDAVQSDTVVIAITGIHGNFYINPFYYNLGDTLTEHGIDFMYGQTCDALGQMETVNVKTNGRESIGSWNEDFAFADEDVAAYVDEAAAAGYAHIVLAGHSLGANKVIHYLATTHDERVEKFILLSPANVGYLVAPVPTWQKAVVKQQIEAGKGQERLPFELLGWIPCNADTAAQWLWGNILDNTHTDPNGDFSQAAEVRQSGALLVGTYDNFTDGDPRAYLENINSHMPSAAQNELVFIERTGHTYQMKEQEMADAVCQLVLSWKEES